MILLVLMTYGIGLPVRLVLKAVILDCFRWSESDLEVRYLLDRSMVPTESQDTVSRLARRITGHPLAVFGEESTVLAYGRLTD